MLDYNLEKRRFVIGGVAIAIVVIYMIRLFTLQIMSDDYKKNADSNAFLKQVEYPSRGAIYDRNGKLMVYNQPSYDIMVVMKEQEGRLDTMDFCNSLGITKEAFEKKNDGQLQNKSVRNAVGVFFGQKKGGNAEHDAQDAVAKTQHCHVILPRGRQSCGIHCIQRL